MNYPWDDDVRGWRVWESDGWATWVVPMLFNHRLVVGMVGDCGYEAGWCYQDRLSAFAAALVFNPRTDSAPPGFFKQATEPWVPLGPEQIKLIS